MASKNDNIIFVGLMGAGKTTVGRQLAKQLGKSFYDSDHEIENRTGVKIPVIFDLEGEEGFRKRETAVIEELVALHNIILATGGGAVLLQENREALKKNGCVIYLRASVNDLWKRMRHDKQRPLLQNVDIRAKLEELYSARNPIYTEMADIIVDTGRQPASVLVNQIKKSILE
jgi:shikimate kinase